jgi:cephalosporin hydroxylase
MIDYSVLTTDSGAYHILYNAAASIKDVPGLVLEIGTRRGGSAKIIIDGLSSVGDRRTVICCDPYGNIAYNPTDSQIGVRLDYTNNMRNETIPALLSYGYFKGMNMLFFNMEDTEFMDRFANGVPIYNQYKTVEDKYALVFFDGPHDAPSIIKEVQHFAERSTVGSKFVFDDIAWYNHDAVEVELEKYGFQLVEKQEPKASYVRVK